MSMQENIEEVEKSEDDSDEGTMTFGEENTTVIEVKPNKRSKRQRRYRHNRRERKENGGQQNIERKDRRRNNRENKCPTYVETR